MDRRFSLAVLFLVACGLAFSPPAALARSDADEEQEEEVSNGKPDAGGVLIEPSSGKIAEGDTITITFPVSMVAAASRRARVRSGVMASWMWSIVVRAATKGATRC